MHWSINNPDSTPTFCFGKCKGSTAFTLDHCKSTNPTHTSQCNSIQTNASHTSQCDLTQRPETSLKIKVKLTETFSKSWATIRLSNSYPALKACWMFTLVVCNKIQNKNDRRNSGGTLRQGEEREREEIEEKEEREDDVPKMSLKEKMQ